MRMLNGCAVLFAGALLCLPQSVLSQGTSPREVRLGYQQAAGGSTAIAAIMMSEKLVEKHAASFGQKITTTWRNFPSGPATNEAMAAGALDISMHMASLPVVALITAGVKAMPIDQAFI